MKFFDIRKFVGTTPEDAVSYLREAFNAGIRDLYAGLRSLNFTNNFRTFTWEGAIAAGATTTITNGLGTIPSYKIIVRAIPQAAGTVIIDDTQTNWTTEFIYLRNTGTAAAKLKVLFFE